MTTKRIAFASDMHGNLAAFEAVLARIEEEGPFDSVIGGGDYMTGGLYPAECLAKIRELDWDCVRGNTDEWIVEAATDGRIPARDYPEEMAHTPEMKQVDNWVADLLDQGAVDFLAELPLAWEVTGPSGQTLKFVHATPWSPHPVVWPDADESLVREMVERGGVDALLYGHVHSAYQRNVSGKQLVCIGAVGLPFDGDARPCFCIAEDAGQGWSMTHVRVAYDRDAYIAELNASEMPGSQQTAAQVRTASRG